MGVVSEEELDYISWDMMDEEEKSFWLQTRVLGNSPENVEDALIIDSNLIQKCEFSIKNMETIVSRYVSNCIKEATTVAYEGLSNAEIASQATMMVYYKCLLMLPVDVRGRCLYWAYKGESV